MSDASIMVRPERQNGNELAAQDSRPKQVPSRIEKRQREALACLLCRDRKLKCDKKSPCNTCVKRKDEASCVYRADQRNPRARTEEKLRHLEGLVEQIMHSEPSPIPQQNLSSPMIASTAGDPLSNGGIVMEAVDGDGLMNTLDYMGSTHWSAVLDGIQELRSSMYESNTSLDGVQEPFGNSAQIAGMLFGQSNPWTSLDQILEHYLPTRKEVDILIATYFRAAALAAPYIHAGRFQKEYRLFWQDPINISPLWISMLFSICSLSSSVYGGHTTWLASNDDHLDRRIQFSSAAAQCLVLGRYHLPQRYGVEALALCTQGLTMGSLDAVREVGPLFSLLIRLAFMMGYHRDPDNFHNISIFEGEMRRRMWSMCMQLDLLGSFQSGLPTNVPSGSWDTKPPLNLLDVDIEDTTERLPPSRSASDPTPMLFFTTKQQIMTVFDKIYRHTSSPGSISDNTVCKLDTEMHELYLDLPDILRPQPMDHSLADPPFLIASRLCVDFLRQKSLCVLHRRGVPHGCEKSTRACIRAGSVLVKDFLEMYAAIQPGGQLCENKWLLNRFIWSDFLLGVTVLCLVLYSWDLHVIDHLTAEDGLEGSSELLKLIERSNVVLVENSTSSREGQKLSQVLQILLSRPKFRSRLEGNRTTLSAGRVSPYASGIHDYSHSRLDTNSCDFLPMNQDFVPNDTANTPDLLGQGDDQYLMHYLNMSDLLDQ